MTQGVGLSVGATNVAAVVPGCAAATRQSVLTLYRHRPPEVGVPSENRRLDERGLIVTGFVERAGDPVGVMAADGSFHRSEALIADALRALTFTVAGGRTPVPPPGVAFPAHWRTAAVVALRRELASSPEWAACPEQLTMTSDAEAALTALQAEPGLPTRGVVALCDFGGTGTTITLADAADGYRPIGAAVRHADFSGGLIDGALLAHVITDLAVGGTADVAGTAAIGSLHRLRAQCRGAKERLSRGAATTLYADVPGARGDIRLTRAELDDEIRQPMIAFIEVLREHLFRNRIHPADLAAVASAGGGANIPIVTTTLSEQLRVPVITTPHPELAAARGAAMRAMRRPENDSLTAVAAPVQSGTLRALAWSAVDSGVADGPDVAAIPFPPDADTDLDEARPRVEFLPDEPSRAERAGQPWYRPILLTAGLFAAMVLVGTGAVISLRNDAAAMTGTTTTTMTVRPDPTTPAAAGPPAGLSVAPEQAPGAPGPVTHMLVTAPPAAMAAPAPAALPPPPANPPPPTTTPPTTTPPTMTSPPTTPPTPTPTPPSSPPPPPSEPPPSEPPPPEPPGSEPPPSQEDPPPSNETPADDEPSSPEAPPAQDADLPK